MGNPQLALALAWHEILVFHFSAGAACCWLQTRIDFGIADCAENLASWCVQHPHHRADPAHQLRAPRHTLEGTFKLCQLLLHFQPVVHTNFGSSFALQLDISLQLSFHQQHGLDISTELSRDACQKGVDAQRERIVTCCTLLDFLASL